MGNHGKEKNISPKREWYPVTILGWSMTAVYTILLIYIVLEINFTLYTTDQVYFRISMLLVALMTAVMVLAKIRGECPFKKADV